MGRLAAEKRRRQDKMHVMQIRGVCTCERYTRAAYLSPNIIIQQEIEVRIRLQTAFTSQKHKII